MITPKCLRSFLVDWPFTTCGIQKLFEVVKKIKEQPVF